MTQHLTLPKPRSDLDSKLFFGMPAAPESRSVIGGDPAALLPVEVAHWTLSTPCLSHYPVNNDSVAAID